MHYKIKQSIPSEGLHPPRPLFKQDNLNNPLFSNLPDFTCFSLIHALRYDFGSSQIDNPIASFYRPPAQTHYQI